MKWAGVTVHLCPAARHQVTLVFDVYRGVVKAPAVCGSLHVRSEGADSRCDDAVKITCRHTEKFSRVYITFKKFTQTVVSTTSPFTLLCPPVETGLCLALCEFPGGNRIHPLPSFTPRDLGTSVWAVLSSAEQQRDTMVCLEALRPGDEYEAERRGSRLF